MNKTLIGGAANETSQVAQPRYQATAEEAKPEGAALPADVSGSRIPIRIRIVDSEGKSIPGFKFQLPANLASRYRLQEPESASTYSVMIWMKKRDRGSDLTADLFEPNSTSASRTVQASGVPEKDLHDRITSLVSSLLEKK